MRFVVFGAGAVGGVVAALLHEAGYDTVVIARGNHLTALSDHGLTLASPEGRRIVPLTVRGTIAGLERRGDDIVLLTTKSQDTHAAVEQIAEWSADVPVVCMQNGVANERTALRRFPDTIGGVVMLPATFLQPGIVAAHSTPTPGIIDVGRWPTGGDRTTGELASCLRSAGFASRVVDDVARWKYRKLLSNLSNVVDALSGAEARKGPVTDLAREEGLRSLDAAGIDHVPSAEDADRSGDLLNVCDAAGQPRQGSSTWQSLARGVGTVETDYLNGEIVLLGRLHGVPTPVNAMLQRLAHAHMASGAPPGSMDASALLRRAEDAVRS